MQAPPALAQRKRLLARSTWVTVPATPAVVVAAYLALAPATGLESAPERIVFALRWLVVAFLPYAAVCLVILNNRFFEGAHDPLQGEESTDLAIHCRVMQNTLEQLVWFALCILPFATYLAPERMHLVPILCVCFAFARLLYWWGYFREGTLGRAPGVQVTFILNIGLLAAVLVQSGAAAAK